MKIGAMVQASLSYNGRGTHTLQVVEYLLAKLFGSICIWLFELLFTVSSIYPFPRSRCSV